MFSPEALKEFNQFYGIFEVRILCFSNAAYPQIVEMQAVLQSTKGGIEIWKRQVQF